MYRKSKMYGLLHNRKKQIGTYIDDKEGKGHLIVWVTNCDKAASEWEIVEKRIMFPCQASIRFTACRGNTIAMMDMSHKPKVWLCDFNGKIRTKISGNSYGLIQPSGACFDSIGNLIMSDSKAKKIIVFGPDGKYLNELQICTNETPTYLQEIQTRMTGYKQSVPFFCLNYV